MKKRYYRLENIIAIVSFKDSRVTRIVDLDRVIAEFDIQTSSDSKIRETLLIIFYKKIDLKNLNCRLN